MSNYVDLNQYVSEGRLFLEHGPDAHLKAYIPTTFRDNHASNLIELQNGDILCTWFAGLSEGSQDIKIALARLNKDSDRWSKPVLVTDDYERSEQNPSLFQDSDGKLWLLHTAQLSRGKMTNEEWLALVKSGKAKGHFTMQGTSEVRLRLSEDNGYTWSDKVSLFTKPGAYCRHPIRQISNGDWLFPMWYSVDEDSVDIPQYGRDYSALQISSDQGKSWMEVQVPESVRRVHMCVVETRPGHIVAFFRSRSADFIYRAISEDYGRTWSNPAPTCLPNNNASIQAIRLQSGAIAIAFNNYGYSKDPDSVNWPRTRCPVTLALTYDEGISFPYMRSLETGESFLGWKNFQKNRTYHYPSIMQSRDGNIHVSYTFHGRDCIMYHRINEDWIIGK